MMKYFTKEVKIALATVVGVVLIFILINFFKGVNLFQPSNTYYIKVPDVCGLNVSSSVYANGYPVGTVRSIEYDYKNSTGAVIAIDLKERMCLPRGSRAEIETSLMGNITMSLVLGPNPVDLLEPGDTISGGEYQGALDLLGGAIPSVLGMVETIDSILTAANQLIASPALAQTLENTATLTGNLANSTARLDQMMTNDIPALVARLDRIAGDIESLSGNLAAIDVDSAWVELNATLANVEGITADLKQVTEALSDTSGTMGLLLNDPALYNNLSSTMQAADSLLTDLKAHPKRYVHFSLFGKKDK